jgi:hypothetical protein
MLFLWIGRQVIAQTEQQKNACSLGQPYSILSSKVSLATQCSHVVGRQGIEKSLQQHNVLSNNIWMILKKIINNMAFCNIISNTFQHNIRFNFPSN